MDDHLIRGTAWNDRVRFVAGVANRTVEELRRIHEPSPATTAALGRLAVGASLLAASLEKVTKREPLVTVELDGDGPAGRFLATASPTGWVRATVANPAAAADPVVNGKLNVAGVVGTEGELAVTRDPGYGEPYRGVIPIRSGEIAQDFAHYLNDSEQTPAAVVLGVFVTAELTVGNAGGFLVQLLPGVSDEEADRLTERVRSIGAVTSRLLAGEGPSSWVDTLFSEGHRILETTPLRFHCGCSAEKVETALKLLGADEIRQLISGPEQPTRLTCEFCKKDYSVSADRLSQLLHEVRIERGELPTN
jgi:molecular chaperone Hsp33